MWLSVVLQLIAIAAVVHFSIVFKGWLDRRYGSQSVLRVSLAVGVLLALFIAWRLMGA